MRYKWSRLSILQKGSFGEHFAKMEFAMFCFLVFSSEVDDRGIDFVARTLAGNHYDVQVKTITNHNYTYISESKFSDTLLVCLIVLRWAASCFVLVSRLGLGHRNQRATCPPSLPQCQGGGVRNSLLWRAAGCVRPFRVRGSHWELRGNSNRVARNIFTRNSTPRSMRDAGPWPAGGRNHAVHQRFSRAQCLHSHGTTLCVSGSAHNPL
jgi:hypothetical protein